MELTEIHDSFFLGREKDRFVYLWEALSKIVAIPAGKIRPEDKIADLFPRSNWSPVSVEMDDLTDFVIRQSKGKRATSELKTVGEVILFLLE